MSAHTATMGTNGSKGHNHHQGELSGLGNTREKRQGEMLGFPCIYKFVPVAFMICATLVT